MVKEYLKEPGADWQRTASGGDQGTAGGCTMMHIRPGPGRQTGHNNTWQETKKTDIFVVLILVLLRIEFPAR